MGVKGEGGTKETSLVSGFSNWVLGSVIAMGRGRVGSGGGTGLGTDIENLVLYVSSLRGS